MRLIFQIVSIVLIVGGAFSGAPAAVSCPWQPAGNWFGPQVELEQFRRDREAAEALPEDQRIARLQEMRRRCREEGNRRLEGLACLVIGQRLAADQPADALDCLADPVIFRHTTLSELAVAEMLSIAERRSEFMNRVDVYLGQPDRAVAFNFKAVARLVELFRRHGRSADARRWLEATDPATHPDTPVDWWHLNLGRLDRDAGRTDEAVAHWRAVLTADGEGATWQAAYDELARAVGDEPVARLFAPADAVPMARGRLAAGGGRAAWACLGGFLPDWTPDSDRDPFWRVAGEAALMAGRTRQALDLYQRFRPETPADRLARAFGLALAHKRLKNAKEFRKMFRLVGQWGPGSDEHLRLLQAVAFDAELTGRLEEVRQSYADIARLSTRRAVIAEANWKLAWTEYMRGKWARADELFLRAVDLDDGREFGLAGLYWHGVCARRRHQRSEADDAHRALVNAFPYSYYAELVRQGWGGPPPANDGGAATDRWLRLLRGKNAPGRAGAPADPWELLAPPDRIFVQEALAAGARETAFRRLAEANQSLNAPAVHALLAGLAAEDGRTYDLIWHAHRSCPDLYMRPLETDGADCWRVLFPLRYEEILQRELADTGVDPLVALALIRQESAFLEDARSVSNAIGLMQLLPVTAADEAGFRGDPADLVPRLKIPEYNLPLGCRYLVKQYRLFDRRMALALAAYNGGPRRIRDVSRLYEKKWNMPEIVEMIPMSQSRNYVKAIYRNWNYYSRLYHGRPADLAWFFGRNPAR